MGEGGEVGHGTWGMGHGRWEMEDGMEVEDGKERETHKLNTAQ